MTTRPSTSISLHLVDTTAGARFKVHVIPRASRNEIAGRRGDALLCRVTVAPVAGKANQAVTRLVADTLDVPKSSVRVTRGTRTRTKEIQVEGLSPSEVLDRLDLTHPEH